MSSSKKWIAKKLHGAPVRYLIETDRGEHVTDYVFKVEEANLIAAAPDLLEALQLVMDDLDKSSDGRVYEDAFDAVRNAIAKATGK